MSQRRIGEFAVLAVAAVVVAMAWTSTRGAAGAATSHSARNPDWTVTVSLARSSARVGATIPVTFTIVNTTGHRVRVVGCPGQEYEVVLGNQKVPNRPIEPADLCEGWMSPGVHVVHALVATTYEVCGAPGVPRCGNPPTLSDLPPGVYRTQILLPTSPMTIPAPAPLTVTLTR